mmetsp:Transcript_33863/g.66616  ORF Transcript_33863/g.66616 Transcript_33863/m.66616 type:complete len:397 (+) Transcript_33863:4751-5941(+)
MVGSSHHGVPPQISSDLPVFVPAHQVRGSVQLVQTRFHRVVVDDHQAAHHDLKVIDAERDLTVVGVWHVDVSQRLGVALHQVSSARDVGVHRRPAGMPRGGVAVVADIPTHNIVTHHYTYVGQPLGAFGDLGEIGVFRDVEVVAVDLTRAVLDTAQHFAERVHLAESWQVQRVTLVWRGQRVAREALDVLRLLGRLRQRETEPAPGPVSPRPGDQVRCSVRDVDDPPCVLVQLGLEALHVPRQLGGEAGSSEQVVDSFYSVVQCLPRLLVWCVCHLCFQPCFLLLHVRFCVPLTYSCQIAEQRAYPPGVKNDRVRVAEHQRLCILHHLCDRHAWRDWQGRFRPVGEDVQLGQALHHEVAPSVWGRPGWSGPVQALVDKQRPPHCHRLAGVGQCHHS